MSPSFPSESELARLGLMEAELLQTILDPLLDDFQHWFSRSLQLLDTEPLPFLSPEQRQDLRDRLSAARQEVTAAQTLFHATGRGISTGAIVPWHNLITECWQVALRARNDIASPDLHQRPQPPGDV